MTHPNIKDMTIEQFCTKHRACKEGKEWALAFCASMKEVWEKAQPDWLLWVATRPSVLTDKELRLFAVSCARQVQHLMTDPRSIEAINVAEKYAQGKAAHDELVAARAAADAAAYAAAYAAADAADAAAGAAAYAAARAAARAAADAAAYAAAYAAARAAAYAAARAAARAAADAAAYAAADAAADAAARAAADAAAYAAADAAAYAAASAEIKESQATWLRENTTPNFL